MTTSTRPAVLTVDTRLPDAGYVNPPQLVLHAPPGLYWPLPWQHIQTSDEVIWGVRASYLRDFLPGARNRDDLPWSVHDFCMAYIRDQANPRDGGALGTDHLRGAWSSNADAFNRAMSGWVPELIEATWNSTRTYVEVAWARERLPPGWALEVDGLGNLIPVSELYPARR